MTDKRTDNLVPKLRFPEFNNKEEWERKTIEEILTVNSGRDYKHLQPGNIPVYGTGGYMLSVNDKLSDVDAIGIGRKGTIDKPQYLKAPFWTVDTLFYLTKKYDYNLKFLFYLLQTIEWKKYSEQTGVPSLTRASIEGIEVKVPKSLEEQQKIASCLSSIDSYISSINEKIEQLKAHKKSLMQKLFPQNGQTIPEYRFPEFESAGMWKKIKFNDVFSRITERNTKNCQNVLTISAKYGLVSQYDYFHKNIAASDISNYYLIQKGDFAYNKSRSKGYPFGAIRSLQLYNEGVVSTLYICFRTKYDKYSGDFFDHYFETELINVEIGKIAQEGARNHGLLNISTDDFFNKIFILVPSPSEQKKIADFLSSIDRTIFFYAQKALLLEQQKKGLTQQLFPTL